jgi:hypothetical protein
VREGLGGGGEQGGGGEGGGAEIGETWNSGEPALTFPRIMRCSATAKTREDRAAGGIGDMGTGKRRLSPIKTRRTQRNQHNTLTSLPPLAHKRSTPVSSTDIRHFFRWQHVVSMVYRLEAWLSIGESVVRARAQFLNFPETAQATDPQGRQRGSPGAVRTDPLEHQLGTDPPEHQLGRGSP